MFGPKNEIIRTTDSQDNLGHHRLSLLTHSVTTDYGTRGQPDNLFQESSFIRIFMAFLFAALFYSYIYGFAKNILHLLRIK